MAVRALSRSKLPNFTCTILRDLMNNCISDSSKLFHTRNPICERQSSRHNALDSDRPILGFRHYHDGRPRGSLWRGKKLIGKEALFVVQGLKRFKDDDEKLGKFIKSHVSRLLKMDMIAVLNELERQEQVTLALKIFMLIQKEDWYTPDVYLYKDLIIALAKSKMMEEAMQVWESLRKEGLFPDSQTYSEVIRGFLRFGSPADAMNIYEDMKKSPEPPQELPFRILLKGLLPHPLLRNRVKQDFEEFFPDRHVYDPPEEIFGIH